MLEHLYSDGIITAEDYKHYSMNYAIIIRKPSFFSNFWKKDNPAKYTLVKQLSWSDKKITENKKQQKKLEVINIEKFRDDE